MPVAFVQGNSSTGASASTQTVTLNGVVSGNLLIVVVCGNGTRECDTITDGSNTYTKVATVVDGGNNAELWCFYAKNVTGGNLTIQANFNVTAGDGQGMLVHEVSGIDTASPFDQEAGQVEAPGTGTDATNSGAVTTTTNGQYIFGAVFQSSMNCLGRDYAAGTNFTARTEQACANNILITSESLVQTSAGSIDATFTANHIGTSAIKIMTFKAAAAATLTPSVNDSATVAEAQTPYMSFYTGTIQDAPTVTEAQTMHLPIHLRMEKLS